MKVKSSLLLILTFAIGVVNAQQVKIIESENVVPVKKGEYTISGVTPNGKSILVTKPHSSGLYLIDIKSGETRTITDLQGSGYRPAFSKRGKYIIYRSDDFFNKIRFSSLYKMKISSGDTSVLVSNKRTVSTPIVEGNNIIYTVEGKLKSKQFYWLLFTNPLEETFVMQEDLMPVLWERGQERVFLPGGEGSYIWVSLSPNKAKVLYYLAGKGAFVCDLNGKILLSAGNLISPCWIDNKYIAGVGTHDFIEKSIATDIVAYSIKTGKRIVITNTEKVNERNPFVFAHGKKIAYQTTAGTLNVIRIKLK